MKFLSVHDAATEIFDNFAVDQRQESDSPHAKQPESACEEEKQIREEHQT